MGKTLMIHKLVIAASTISGAGLVSPLLHIPAVLLDGTTLPTFAPMSTGVPTCLGPRPWSNRIDKENVVYDSSCAPLPWQAPRRIQTFSCDRYQCANGAYYLATSTSLGDCTDQGLYSNPCPNDGCSQTTTP